MENKIKMNKEMKGIGDRMAVLLLSVVFVLSLAFVVALPEGPSGLNEISETSKTLLPNLSVTTGGGNISIVNLSASVVNQRWKAFVGNVSGTFSLADARGSVIYDWDVATVTGRVYATRHSSAIAWADIACATTSQLETENVEMSHNDSNDNVTTTFSGSTHDQFYVGAVNIPSDNCSTLNTYQSNSSQDTVFEEMALIDTTNNYMVYATILEQDAAGFDGDTYDFQMIVPEKGNAGSTVVTTYYMYVELGND